MRKGLPLVRESELALRIIALQYPEFRNSEISFLGSGCDYTTFALDGQTVFRFAQRNEYREQIRFEIFVLKAIANKIPLKIPYPKWVGNETKEYPFPFFGYPYIEGTQHFTDNLFIESIDAFLQPLIATLCILHSQDKRKFEEVVPPMSVYRDTPQTVFEENRVYYKRIKENLEGDLRMFSKEFWSRPRYEMLPYDSNRKVLIHSDLSMEHVLFKNGINGIIDWGDVGIGNPIWDFVGLWMWGGDKFLLSAIKQYSIADFSAYLNTIRFLGICSAFGEIEYGYSKPSRNHIRIGQTALRHALESFDLL